LARTFDAAPEVASAHHDCDVRAQFLACFTHFGGYLGKNAVVKAKSGWLRKCLTREFEHDA
jgi:hypothetical protein